jgi:hypothetical protein
VVWPLVVEGGGGGGGGGGRGEGGGGGYPGIEAGFAWLLPPYRRQSEQGKCRSDGGGRLGATVLPPAPSPSRTPMHRPPQEPEYLGQNGEYRIDAGASPTMLKSLMYKLSYYE